MIYFTSKLRCYETSQQFFTTIFHNNFKLLINRFLPVFLFFLILPFSYAQFDCSSFGINVNYLQDCKARFSAIIPVGKPNPDWITWTLYNSYLEPCDYSEEDVWTKEFCFDDTYTIEMTVHYGNEKCTITKEHIIITCTPFTCNPISAPKAQLPKFRKIYVDPGCYGTSYLIEFSPGLGQSYGCQTLHYKIEYIEPENVLVNPCPGPGASIYKTKYSDGESVCIWVKNGLPVRISVAIDSTCCNPEMCLERTFTSEETVDYPCPGIQCDWELDDCPNGGPGWKSLLPCSTNLTAGDSDKEYEAIENLMSSEMKERIYTGRNIQSVSIYDVQGREIYQEKHPELSKATRGGLQERYYGKMVKGINIFRLRMEGGKTRTMKIIKIE